ncbi:MAG: T9SS type A sorting domain-containing protein [Flavobacterium sp.]
MYPNPSDDFVIIESFSTVDAISIYAVNGQLVEEIIQPKFENNNFKIENLTSGLYFVKISIEGEFIYKKLIIN